MNDRTGRWWLRAILLTLISITFIAPGGAYAKKRGKQALTKPTRERKAKPRKERTKPRKERRQAESERRNRNTDPNIDRNQRGRNDPIAGRDSRRRRLEKQRRSGIERENQRRRRNRLGEVERRRLERERRHVRRDNIRHERRRHHRIGRELRRERWRRYQRRLHRNHRDIHRAYYWRHHYRHWWDWFWWNRPAYVYRPTRPIVIIEWPDTREETWNYGEIIDVADNIERTSLAIFEEAERLLTTREPWNDNALSALYDLSDAAQVYSDALATKPTHLEETLNELFNLEEAFTAAKLYIQDARIPTNLKENFNYAEYYLQEVMWTYRQDLGDLDNLRDVYDDLSDVMSFRWSSPHDYKVWTLGSDVSYARALTITNVNSYGRKGSNGVMGISQLYVVYEDGTSQDVVADLQGQRDSHADVNGQLALRSSTDRIRVTLKTYVRVARIEVQADSWIAPDVNAQLLLSLDELKDLP